MIASLNTVVPVALKWSRTSFKIIDGCWDASDLPILREVGLLYMDNLINQQTLACKERKAAVQIGRNPGY